MAEPLPPHPCPGFFAVLRHGGRSNDVWRLMMSTQIESGAEEAFMKTYRAMRQGALVLLSPEAKKLRYYEAPLLRSRW